MQSEILKSNRGMAPDNNEQNQELFQALLNTCIVSKTSQNTLYNLIENTLVDNITFNDLNQTSQELYKALLNTCSISDEAKQILCTMLNNTGNGNDFIDIPYQEHTARIIINHSRTLNLTPRQVDELQASFITPIVIDTIEADDSFYHRNINQSYAYGLITINQQEFYYMANQEYITYISTGYDNPFIRTKIPLGTDNIIEIRNNMTIQAKWYDLWGMYRLSNELIPLKLHIENSNEYYSITDMYCAGNGDYEVILTSDLDSHTMSFSCEHPDDWPTPTPSHDGPIK